MRLSTDHAPLRDRDMLCFSHDWDSDPLSKTHLMRLLARDNRVLWVNSIGYRAPTLSGPDAARAMRKLLAAVGPLREAEPNLFILNPLVIPAHGSSRIRSLNRWLLRTQLLHAMKRMRFTRPINWVFNPAAALAAGSLGEDTLIYYCVDEYAAFSGVPAASIGAMERQLLNRADLVITSSQRLLDAKRPHNSETVLVRHGVDWHHFRQALDPTIEIPADLAAIRGPILGYFGLIAKDWVDVGLIAHIARSLPRLSIVMFGKITMDVSALRQLSNVHLLGHRPYELLPAYCKGFDAAMIPFPISEVTLSSNPLKAREYLAAGLPVVSTAIPEVQALGRCRIGRTPAEVVQHIQAALAQPGPAEATSDAVQSESWEARLDEITAHIARITSASRGTSPLTRPQPARLAA